MMYGTMKYKSKVDRSGLDSESVKEMELDEEPRPVRKAESPAVPTTDSATTTSHRKIKGTRKIR